MAASMSFRLHLILPDFPLNYFSLLNEKMLVQAELAEFGSCTHIQFKWSLKNKLIIINICLYSSKIFSIHVICLFLLCVCC